MLRKLKALVTGERQDLQSGELVDLPGRYEKPDPTPLAPAIGYKREPSLAEKIRQMVRSEKLRQEAEAAGAESFEEADDFDVGDDYDPTSPYEGDFEPLAKEEPAGSPPTGPTAEGAPAPVPAAPTGAAAPEVPPVKPTPA